MKRWIPRVFLGLVCFFPICCLGDETTTEGLNPACPDAQVLSGRLITDISWSTLFPMRIAGVAIGGSDIPEGAADPESICICQDNLGVVEVGTQISMWEPTALIEIPRIAYCAPSLGGTFLQSNPRLIGGPGEIEYDTSDLVFYNYHYYSFPLLVILDLFIDEDCNDEGYMDFDILYLSELDPTWNDDELAFWTNPEVALFANPVAIAAEPYDAVMSTAGRPVQRLYWTAGTWGLLYPFTGNVIANASPPRDSSLVATKALAALHRRGLARKTMGDDAMCRSRIYPTILKDQYKMSMFYPVAEVKASQEMAPGEEMELKGSHWIGQSPYTWGEWRNIPGVGEDFVYTLWRWRDCCSR